MTLGIAGTRDNWLVRDGSAEVLVGIDQIVDCLDSLNLPMSTYRILRRVYRSLEPLAEYSTMVLTSPAASEQGGIDLRHLEGAGFYQRIGSTWIYHKGGGSVEAALIWKALGGKPRFRGFGVELPGSLGRHGVRSILGLKPLGPLAHELCVGIALLARFVQSLRTRSHEAVLGQCSIPFALVRMKGLEAAFRQHESNLPAYVRDCYMAGGAPFLAKLCSVVPSPVRATDKRDVWGKWEETQNVFFRTLSLPRTRRHHYGIWNPYWSRKNSYLRGRSIRFLLDAGFVYEPASAHLQNMYAIRGWKGGSPVQLTADMADVMILADLEPPERRLFAYQMLGGWRIAECLGPSPLPDPGIGSRVARHSIEEFFRGLLHEHDVGELTRLYMLLPRCISLVVAEDLAAGLVGKQMTDARRNWSLLGGKFNLRQEMERHVGGTLEGLRQYERRFFGASIDLRPEPLLRCLRDGLRGNANEDYRSLLHLADALTRIEDPRLRREWTVGWGLLVEASLRREAVLSEHGAYADSRAPWDDLEEMWRLSFGEVLQRGVRKGLLHIEDLTLEVLHIRAPAIRQWISIQREEESSTLDGWLSAAESSLDRLVADGRKTLDTYLGYLFKRAGQLDQLQGRKPVLRSPALRSPVRRMYPSFRIRPKARVVVGRKSSTLAEDAASFLMILCNLPAPHSARQYL